MACKPSAILRVLRRSFHASKLDTRGLIAVSGTDTASFLQGLITNDVTSLTESKQQVVPAIYSLMLNVQGRVINDFVVYYLKNKTAAFPADTLLLDTDLSLIPQTITLFKKYRLRRKLEFSDVTNRYSQFSLWNFESEEKAVQQIENFTNGSQMLFLNNDPRLANLGKRLLVSDSDAESTLKKISSSLNEKFVLQSSNEQWKIHRYRFAVPEGAIELPPGKCLPLESNCDFLNGVSFSKGCYIGQELTARTHNIGVTRKRLLPIKIEGSPGYFVPEAKLLFESSDGLKPAGEIRVVAGNCGLALVRIQFIDPSIKSSKLYLIDEKTKSKNVCHVTWPEWFPPLKSIIDKMA